MMKMHKVLVKCLSGVYEILQSLSGTFALITLFVIAGVTFHSPMIGAAALAAFATVVPSILAYAENKETLQQAALQAQQAVTQTTTVINPAPTVVTVNTADNTNTASTAATTTVITTDNSNPTNSDLPTNGQT